MFKVVLSTYALAWPETRPHVCVFCSNWRETQTIVLEEEVYVSAESSDLETSLFLTTVPNNLRKPQPPAAFTNRQSMDLANCLVPDNVAYLGEEVDSNGNVLETTVWYGQVLALGCITDSIGRKGQEFLFLRAYSTSPAKL
jgi:hypothetical protein